MASNNSEVSLLRIRDVIARVGLARATIYERIARGQFPAAVYPTPGAPRWRSDAIANWIESLSESRDRAA